MPDTTYQRLYNVLRERIHSGEYLPGQRLLNERELSERFGVSRITTRHALMLLQRDGYVERRPRCGTVVRPLPPRKIPIVDGDFAGAVQTEAKNLDRRLISRYSAQPPDYVRRALGLLKHDVCVIASREESLDSFPIALDNTFIPHEYGRKLSDSMLKSVEFLALWLKAENIVLSHIRQTIEAVLPSEQIGKALGIHATEPIMATTEVVFSTSNVAVMFVETFYRGDRWQLVSQATAESATVTHSG
ncbi:MAG: GntR family transcriptional regulator [Spirochaetaceae bacterium]|nr:MAG: GntR family transcriptional regulator [Spirochaetaceae bacterium]